MSCYELEDKLVTRTHGGGLGSGTTNTRGQAKVKKIAMKEQEEKIVAGQQTF